MLGLCVVALATARAIERSALGYGFAAIRDDEAAAEASGVPTLQAEADRHGAVAAASWAWPARRCPIYVTYLDPASAFSLNYAVNAIAMPLIGGTDELAGPGDRRGAARRPAGDLRGDDLLGASTCWSRACCWSPS